MYSRVSTDVAVGAFLLYITRRQYKDFLNRII